MIVLIDDLREISADVVLRDADSAMKFINEVGDTEIDLLILDHDLADTGQEQAQERTGYTILTYMLDETSVRPKAIHLVTSNPVGRNKMTSAASHAGYLFNFTTQQLEYIR